MEHIDLLNKEIQDLIDIASKPLVQKEKLKASVVYSFILDKNIEAGETAITPAKIYDAFKDWYDAFKDKSSFKEPITEAKFYKDFKKYFNHQRRRRQGDMFYLLDSSPFDMSEQAEFKLQQRLKKKHGKKE